MRRNSGVTLVRRKENVCRDRAKLAAEKDFLHLINEKKEEFKKTKRPEFYQQSLLLYRKMKVAEDEYYEKFLENYKPMNDSFVSFKERTKDADLKSFNEALLEELSKI